MGHTSWKNYALVHIRRYSLLRILWDCVFYLSFLVTVTRTYSGSMRPITRSPSPASTVFSSDDEISVPVAQARSQPTRRDSSSTTLANSVDSHEKASRTIILCLEGSDQRFGVDYAKDFMSLLEKGNSAQQKVYCNHQRGRRDLYVSCHYAFSFYSLIHTGPETW